MSTLNDYLIEKRAAVLAREARIASGAFEPVRLAASVSAEGRSGVRRVRIREHQIISDSPPILPATTWGPALRSSNSACWARA